MRKRRLSFIACSPSARRPRPLSSQPICFISGNYTATTVHRDNLEVRKNLTVCKLPVSSGAGYDLVRLPMDRILRYGMASTQFCCCAARGEIKATVGPTGFTQEAPVKGADLEDFLQRMWQRMPPTVGKASIPYGAPALGSIAVNTRCGANTRTLAIYENGLATLTEVQSGITTIRNVDAAVLSQLSYIRYVKAPFCQAMCCGKDNNIELVFEGEKYIMESHAAADALPAFNEIVKSSLLGRAPAKSIKTMGGIAGSIEVGPEFTTVTAQECAWGGPACMSVEVTTIKTKDISHLRATLPSWINALVRAIRDVQIAAITAKCSQMWGSDLAIFPVWPISFFHTGYLAIIMIANAVISIFRFIVIFFCRKTAVIIGGPGPAKEVVLPTVEEKPDELLQDLANSVTIAQACYTWPVAAVIVYTGAAKSSSSSTV